MSAPARRPRVLERGEVSEMVIVLVVGLFLVVGLVVDGGAKMTASAHALGVAQGAARYGAQQIGTLPTTGGHGAQIDPAKAQSAAESYLANSGVEGSVAVTAEDHLIVTATAQEPTTFLGIIGIHTVSATRTVDVDLLHGDEVAPQGALE